MGPTVMPESSAMKSMNLYTDLDRIVTELRELGHSDVREGGRVPAADVHKVTMMSYSGVNGCKDVVERLGLKEGMRMLDLGSGVGGPARVVAELSNCKVTGLEYQEDLHEMSEALTKACGLDGLMSGVCADASATDLPAKVGGEGVYDAIVSWLAILHIPGRDALFRNMAAVLKQGGHVYIEDFFRREEAGEFTQAQSDSLAVDVSIPGGKLPTKAMYIAELEAAGFTSIEFIDITKTWTDFVSTRHDAYVAAKDRHIRVHNEGVYNRMNHFYSSVRALFENSPLGGVRIIAKRA